MRGHGDGPARQSGAGAGHQLAAGRVLARLVAAFVPGRSHHMPMPVVVGWVALTEGCATGRRIGRQNGRYRGKSQTRVYKSRILWDESVPVRAASGRGVELEAGAIAVAVDVAPNAAGELAVSHYGHLVA